MESWLEDANMLENIFSDYSVHLCPAFKSNRGGRNMAGVIVFVKTSLALKYTRIFNDFKFGVFLKFDNFPLGNQCKFLVLACVYIPPDGSPLYDRVGSSVIELLENELISSQITTGNTDIVLCGDFNARTGELQENVHTSSNVPEMQEFEDILSCKVTKSRVSTDKTVNRLGREFINLLRTYDLYIVNSRIGEDINTGDYTYIDTRGCSVIDYFICSAGVFESIANFKIECNGLLKHLPLQMILKCAFVPTSVTNVN